jgi:hypothetical protein
MLLNIAFFPTLMWNSRFASLSGDPFDNSAGFQFQPPGGLSLSTEQHLLAGARTYSPVTAGLDLDLCGPMGPTVLDRIDPLLRTPVVLSDTEFRQLVDFVRNGLLDPRARPENLRRFIPDSVPSGRPVHAFE